MRFVIDRHLGRLAKWLRTLGYDAFFQVDCDDRTLASESRKPDSLFITSSKPVTSRIDPIRSIVVDKTDIGKQLREIISATGIDLHAQLFSRCVICNLPVKKVSKEERREKIPERVFEMFDEFTECSSCGRVYWMGTHTARLIKHLEELIGGK
ncbi:MAG: hypothetical protein FJ215_05910 [Ignavibacteria bacterium]|nr:hypothetical protein [Ignavibacteria bacterium]